MRKNLLLLILLFCVNPAFCDYTFTTSQSVPGYFNSFPSYYSFSRPNQPYITVPVPSFNTQTYTGNRHRAHRFHRSPFSKHFHGMPTGMTPPVQPDYTNYTTQSGIGVKILDD